MSTEGEPRALPPRHNTPFNDRWPHQSQTPSSAWLVPRSMRHFVVSINNWLEWYFWQCMQEWYHASADISLKYSDSSAAQVLNPERCTSEEFLEQTQDAPGPLYSVFQRSTWTFLRNSNTVEPEFFIADDDVRFEESSTLAPLIPHVLVSILSYLPAPDLFFGAMPSCSTFYTLSSPIKTAFREMHDDALRALQEGRTSFNPSDQSSVVKALGCFEEALLGFSYGSNVDAMLVCLANIGGSLDYLKSPLCGFGLQMAALRLARDERSFVRICIVSMNLGIISSHLSLESYCSNFFFLAIHALLLAEPETVRKLERIIRSSIPKLHEPAVPAGPTLSLWSRLLMPEDGGGSGDGPYSPDRSSITGRSILKEFVALDVVEEVLSANGFSPFTNDSRRDVAIDEFINKSLADSVFGVEPYDYFAHAVSML